MSFNDQWDFLPDCTGFLLPRPAHNASKPMIIAHDQFRIIVFAWMCVCVLQWRKVYVRSGSVAVESDIYYSDQWWRQAYL